MISICMATFNGEKYIRQQIDSILNQLCATDEIVISDDASFDNTLDILNSYNDPRIKIYKNEQKLGVIRNFENALAKASNDYIFLADQDDIWEHNKIAECLTCLKTNSLVVTDCSFIDGNGRILISTYLNGRTPPKYFFSILLKNYYIGSCMAFRKEVLGLALPFPANIPMHDWWIALVTSLHLKIGFIDQPLVRHRVHQHNASSTGNNSLYSFTAKIMMRLKLTVLILQMKIKASSCTR